jgi:DNA primase
MDQREQTRTLNQIPINIVGSWLGLKLPAHGMTRCPFHDHPDTNPSFEVKASGNRWICYGCDRKGGSIDLVKTYNSVDFLEAKKWLLARAGFNESSSIRRQPDPTTFEPAQCNIPTDEAAPDNEVYNALIEISALQPSGLEYLSGRAISSKTAAMFRVGQLTDTDGTLGKLIRAFGFQRVNAAGLLTMRSTSRDARLLFPEGSLLFPFLENSEVIYLQARMIGSAEARGKWRNLNYRRRRVYNEEILRDKTVTSVAICEGVIDTLSAVELGYQAIGLMGVNTKLTKEQFEHLRGKDVSILLDWDTAGEARSEELRTELGRLGIVSVRKRCPTEAGNDLNDFLLEQRAHK